MHKEDIEKTLTEGLLGGYVGKTTKVIVNRGNFQLEGKHILSGNSDYDDQWIADRTGGGQEIIKVGNERFTRLYGGGVIKNVEKLGITIKDVTNNLKKSLKEAGSRTRLFSSYGSGDINGFEYSYIILENIDKIPLTIGRESIQYKNKTVFVHFFILCPVE